MSGTHHYGFGPGVTLRVRAGTSVLRHFDREYQPAAGDSADPQVEVEIRFGRARGSGQATWGGHKTARWQVSLGDPGDSPLRAWLGIVGAPPSFALSLVQGYFVEPLVAVALARADYVALPSAAFGGGPVAHLLMGRSRTGKSSLSMRALADGRPLLGDDQVILDGSGRCWPYPRRLRVYPDIRRTAPAAWSRLPGRTRRALRLRGAVKRLSRGYIAPSLSVAPSELDAGPWPRAMPVGRLVVIDRAADGTELRHAARDSAWAVEAARDVLVDQRRTFASLAGTSWQRELAAVVAQEERTLAAAWADLDVRHVRVPAHWAAPRAVGELEAHLRALG